jgi:hypothetical protein
MSKIQLSELKATSLTVLNETETSAVVGGLIFGSSITSRSFNRQIGANSNLLVQVAYYGGNGAGVGQTVNNTIG